jgi:hypothetical protein
MRRAFSTPEVLTFTWARTRSRRFSSCFSVCCRVICACCTLAAVRKPEQMGTFSCSPAKELTGPFR